MNNFATYTVALDLVRALRPVVAKLRAHSPDIADQVERAGTSLVLNIGEGARRSGRDPRRFYVMANGSASEIRAALDVAGAWGWHVDDAEARKLLDRELGLLWGLVHPRRDARSRHPD
jgi:four helix bundle protein